MHSKNAGGCLVYSTWWSPAFCSSTSPASGLTSSRPLLSRGPFPMTTSCVCMEVRVTVVVVIILKPLRYESVPEPESFFSSFFFCSMHKHLGEESVLSSSKTAFAFILCCGFLTLTKTADYSLHNTADFKKRGLHLFAQMSLLSRLAEQREEL